MYMDMDMDMDIHAAAFHGDLDTDEWTHMQSSTQRWMLLLVPPTHAVGPSCPLYRWRLCGARKKFTYLLGATQKRDQPCSLVVASFGIKMPFCWCLAASAQPTACVQSALPIGRAEAVALLMYTHQHARS